MKFRIGLVLLVLLSLCFGAKSQCSKGCEALASYYVLEGTNLSTMGHLMDTTDVTIASYNKGTVPNQYSVLFGTRVNVPFTCGCVNGIFLGHRFEYDVVSGDTYTKVATEYYANLTTVEDMEWFNDYPANNIPNTNAKLNVVVNCSCGNSSVSEDYGLFITYPLRPGETLASIAGNGSQALDQTLLQNYNPGVNFSSGSGIVFIPGKDEISNWASAVGGAVSLFRSKIAVQQRLRSLASYYVLEGTNLSTISHLMNTTDVTIASYNKGTVPNQYSVLFGTRVNVPFTCGCVNGTFLGHRFEYDVVSGDTYTKVATEYYANLTTMQDMEWFNDYPANNVPNTNAKLNVVVNCSCGNSSVSEDYGLFITYPLRPGETLASIAGNGSEALDQTLLQNYNPGVNFSSGSGIVFIPGKDQNGNYVPLKPISAGLAGGAIAGITVGVIAGILLLAGCVYFGFYRKKKVDTTLLLPSSEDQSSQNGRYKSTESNSAGKGPTGITVDKSVEFSFEELSRATDNFSLANKIGQGGFGAVYHAELRGEKAAIKKMDRQASKEFLAELNVLTRVHHMNLVRLIGYCVKGSLFLVYEYIENGNLSQHLRGSERDPIQWSNRVQIALDSARGLEYIHEHTVPVYVHRDIKSANILIDKNYHAKVADFGLTKLTEVESTSLPTRLVGTFGYMPPEYQYGEVSPKVDVYAFGVVLFELISAMEAVVRANASGGESRGLVGLFEEVLDQPDPIEELQKVVDPRLGANYPLDSVLKMAQLAKACVHKNKEKRPSMRSIVVALMTLSSSPQDWDVVDFYENQALVNLMSGS